MSTYFYPSSLAPVGTVPGSPPDSAVYRALLCGRKGAASGAEGLGSGAFVTNTSAGPVSPPTAATHVTLEAGGDKVTWVSPPFTAKKTISKDFTLQTYGKESNGAANASTYVRLGRLEPDGTITWFAATSADGTEFGTSVGTVSRTVVVPAAKDFVAGDRLLLEIYLDDASGVNMAAGYTVTLQEAAQFHLSTGYNGDLPIGGEALMVRDGLVPLKLGYSGGYFVGLSGAPDTPAGRLMGFGPHARFRRVEPSFQTTVRLAASRLFPSTAPVTVWTQHTIMGAQGSAPVYGRPHQFYPARPQLAGVTTDDLRVFVAGGDTSTFVDEWDCSVFYLPAPDIGTPSLPSGTIDDTQRPLCRVVASAILTHWQQEAVPYTGTPWINGLDVEWRIYREADAPGADPPEDEEPVWAGFTRTNLSGFDGGISAEPVTVEIVPDMDLENGEYVLFTRVSRDTVEDVPAGYPLARSYWSDWSKGSSWEIDISLPDAPSTLTITADETNQRIEVKAVVPTTAGYTASTALLSVERSDDVGVTWRPVRGMTDLSVTAGATEWTLGYDLLAPRDRTNLQYRVRANMTHTALAKRFTSAWKTVTDVTGLAALSGSVFLCLDDPAANWSDVQIIGPLEQESGRAATSIAPLDRDGSVVITGTNAGPRGTLKVICAGATQVAKLDALEAAGGPILWGTPYGQTSLIAITGVSRSTYGAAVSPIVEATISYQTLTTL
jgi:hypothetical protein